MLTARQQVVTVSCMYLGYAMFMVLRMAPTVAGNPIIADPDLGVDTGDWGRILATGTIGAVIGKFVGGFAADRLGGRITFFAGLVVSSVGVAMFANSTSAGMLGVSLFIALMAKSAGWPSMTKIIETAFEPTAYGRVWGVLSTSSRVGTLLATFALGGLLNFFAWDSMLMVAAISGGAIAVAFVITLGRAIPKATSSDVREEPLEPPPEKRPHPLDGTSLFQAIAQFCVSKRFWLIVGSLMGLTIMWDFLLMVPLYLKATLGLSDSVAAQASSAFPFGSLFSVLAGGFVFDKLERRATARLMAILLTIAGLCILTFLMMPRLGWENDSLLQLSIVLLFFFGLCVSPCYYIPMSVFSIEFGGPHSGFLVALLDALAFSATAAFYFFAGEWAEQSWTLFLTIMLAVATWSMLTTWRFMVGESKVQRQ